MSRCDHANRDELHLTILWSRYSSSIFSIEWKNQISIYDGLLNLDFNALRTLRLVYRLGSFSKAADAIEIKQSTVSYTIDRLRQALNDPLIVRQGATNVPTERCREIIPIIDRILAEAESLQDDENFDPSKSKAQITIICATFSLRTLIPQVLKRLREDAPDIKVTLLERYHGVPDHLQEGKADIVMKAGEAIKIPLKQVHTAITGSEGVTALVFRVHEKGQPERVPAE